MEDISWLLQQYIIKNTTPALSFTKMLNFFCLLKKAEININIRLKIWKLEILPLQLAEIILSWSNSIEINK